MAIKPRAMSRENFDGERGFVVSRPFLFNNEHLVPGRLLDKSKATTRRLRQLYDLRMVNMTARSSAKVDGSTSEINFKRMSSSEIRRWLTESKVEYRSDFSRAQLIDLARETSAQARS